MSYELSQRIGGGGAIADGYVFYQDRLTANIIYWPFTSAERGFRILDGTFPGGSMDFAPDAGLQRGAIEGTNETQAAQFTVTVAADNPVANQWKQNQPEYPIWLKLYRVQLLAGRAKQVYLGRVVNGDFHDDLCDLTVQSLKSSLQKKLPLKVYSRTCNNVLYDQFCDIADGAFNAIGTITDITGRVVTVSWTAHTPATWPVADGYFTAGRIRRNATDTGGREMVVEHVETTPGSVATLTLLQDNNWLAVGDSILVSAGCDKLAPTCINKFDNIKHFVGFPFIPAVNPYTDGVN